MPFFERPALSGMSEFGAARQRQALCSVEQLPLASPNKTTMTHCQHHRLGTSGVLPSEEPAVHETGESANKCVCNSTMVEGRFAGDKLRVSSRRTGLDHSQAPPSAAEEGEWSGPGT